MEATQKVEATQQVGMLVKTDFDLLKDFALESQRRYFAERGIDPGSDVAKAHLGLVLSIYHTIYVFYRSNECGEFVFNDMSFGTLFALYKDQSMESHEGLFNTDMLGLPIFVDNHEYVFSVEIRRGVLHSCKHLFVNTGLCK